MEYTQIKIKKEYRDKLAKLAESHNRSMANMVEVLIDGALIGTDLHPTTAAQQERLRYDRRQAADNLNRPEPVVEEVEEAA